MARRHWRECIYEFDTNFEDALVGVPGDGRGFHGGVVNAEDFRERRLGLVGRTTGCSDPVLAITAR
jgi:hypothetical protein